MRDDLLDAQAAVDWADTQIPLFNNALTAWESDHPYRIVKEHDPDTGGYLVVALQHEPFPLTFSAWAGAVLNSLRSSLDLLAAALAHRNGERTNRSRHFPIFDSLHDMIDPLRGIDSAERKQWLSDSERAAIKSLKPYKGGDRFIWSLHELDIVRKHERLLISRPVVNGLIAVGSGLRRVWGEPPIEGQDHKTILLRVAPGEVSAITESNTYVSVDVRFHESAFGVADKQAVPVMGLFASRIGEVVKTFNV
jgi:hypothetical protein